MAITVAFVCIGNTCRSQMAEGFAKNLLKSQEISSDKNNRILIYSAGTHPAYEVNPYTVMVMQEKGIDTSGQYPKTLAEIPGNIDILITMGCGVECPYLPAKYRRDWGIDDPVGMPVDFFRKTRDIIENKVKNLINILKESGSMDAALIKLKS